MSNEILTPAVVEQLRILDGHLFQDEHVLSVYLDTKSFVWTYLSSSLRNQSDTSDYVQWKDTFADEVVRTFFSVRPTIEKDLYEVVRKYSSMLGNTNDSIIANPHVSKYLQGIFRRILQHDSYMSKQLIEQDPIKIDFVFREAFRSCLQNDCLTIFEAPSAPIVHPELTETELPKENSPRIAKEEESNTNEKPHDDASSQESEDLEERKSIAKSVAKSVLKPLETKSILKGPSSVVSHAMSAITSVSTIKKPRVKTVFLQEDDAISRFTKVTSRHN